MRIAFEIGAGKLERNWRNVGAGGRVCWSKSLKNSVRTRILLGQILVTAYFEQGCGAVGADDHPSECTPWKYLSILQRKQLWVTRALQTLYSCVCALMRLKLIITDNYQNYIKAQIKYTTHEIAMCHNSHSLSNWHSRITGQLSYKRTFSQNLVSTKNFFPVYDLKNMTCLGLKVD